LSSPFSTKAAIPAATSPKENVMKNLKYFRRIF
jgi:hypothetical protein